MTPNPTHAGSPPSAPMQAASSDATRKQLLHLVFGGELDTIDGLTFKDLAGLEIVGIFPDYASAHMAWKARAQATVDQAHMRFFIVHLHRLLDPARS